MAYYRILCDGYPLMDTRLNDYNLIAPKCTVELNRTGTLSFDIAPSHPHYDKIHKVSSVITLLEDDEIGPETVYGQTKLEGEQIIAEILDKFFILRTAWLYGVHGPNFVEKMLELGSTKAIFVGHDHINTFCVNYQGIYLCYGINSTNRVYFDNSLMGGQVISMDSSNNITIERYFHTYDELEGK